MSVRRKELQLTPRLVPISYPSAEVTEAGNPLFPLFATRVTPLLPSKDVATVSGPVPSITKEAADKIRPRCVYLFVTRNSTYEATKGVDIFELSSTPDEFGNEITFADTFSGWEFPGKGLNLVRAMKVEGEGKIQLFKIRPSGEDFPENLDKGTLKEHIELATLNGLRFFALGTAKPLSKSAMEALMDEPWTNDTEAFDPLNKANVAHAPWVADGLLLDHKVCLPVVDPLFLLQGLSQKYCTASDEALRHNMDIQTWGSEKKIEKDAGSVGMLTYLAARVVQDLEESGVKVGSAGPAAREYVNTYDRKAKDLAKAREQAALNLILWLESEWMTRLGEALYGDTGSHQPHPTASDSSAYEDYMTATATAQERLVESERGRTYLVEVLEKRSVAMGTRRIITEFVLPEAPPKADKLKIARKVAGQLFRLWGTLFPLVSSSVANGITTKEFLTLADASRKLVQRISYLFEGTALDVVVHPAIAMQRRFHAQLFQFAVEQVEVRVVREAALKKANVDVTMASDLLKTVNVALAYNSCWEALGNSHNRLAQASSALEFASSLGFVGDKVQKSTRGEALRKLLFRTDVAKVASTRLAAFLCVMEVAASGMKVADSYRQGDWDRAAAEGVKGVGSAVSLAALIMGGAAVAAGGVALLPVLVGVAGISLVMGGSIWAEYAQDTPYEKLAKFSRFGEGDKSSVINPDDRAWMMGVTYADWDPTTAAGLSTYLQATKQLSCSFQMRGTSSTGTTDNLSSDVPIEFTFCQLLSTSKVHLDVHLVYSSGKEIKAKIFVLFSADLKKAQRNDASNQLRSIPNILVNDVDGKHQVIIRLRLPLLENGMPPSNDILNATIMARLDLYGDGDLMNGGAKGSLLIPTTHEGEKWVKLDAVERGARNATPVKSLTFNDLS